MTKRFYILALPIMASLSLFVLTNQARPENKTASKSDDKDVKWVTYDKGLELAKKQNKHIVVDFYTTWCGWCKKMDRDTYENSEITSLLSQNYIPVKLNAESSRVMKIGGKDVTERQVAQQFKVSGFPTTCFLKPDGSRIDCLPGYQGPDNFANILSYIKDRAYEKNLKMDEYLEQRDAQDKKGKS